LDLILAVGPRSDTLKVRIGRERYETREGREVGTKRARVGRDECEVAGGEETQPTRNEDKVPTRMQDTTV
jgi:hypothetical protein